MDDALNTSSFRQPNTFMDVMVSKSPRRGEPIRSNTLMRSAVQKPEPSSRYNEQPKIQTSFNNNDLKAAANSINQSPLISRLSPSIYDEPRQNPLPERQTSTVQYPSIEEAYEPHQVPQVEVEAEPTMDFAASDIGEGIMPAPNFNVFNPSVPAINSSLVESVGDTFKLGARKLLSGWTVLGIAIIGIVASVVFINGHISNVEFYLASSKAGFTATMPHIKPSGYDLSGISTGGGVIEASYKSNTDSRTYNISEKKSSISSSYLLNGYVTNQAGTNYQTVKTSGKTIYIYNGHDATWVNDGIWYVVQDNDSLSDSQIINIANSM